MARPQAEILLNEEHDCITTDIIKGDSLYAVLYKEQPINLRIKTWNFNGGTVKYPKTVFTTKKPAENMALRLNQQFNSEDFTARKIL